MSTCLLYQNRWFLCKHCVFTQLQLCINISFCEITFLQLQLLTYSVASLLPLWFNSPLQHILGCFLMYFERSPLEAAYKIISLARCDINGFNCPPIKRISERAPLLCPLNVSVAIVQHPTVCVAQRHHRGQLGFQETPRGVCVLPGYQSRHRTKGP